jgi:hypothetical protein
MSPDNRKLDGLKHLIQCHCVLPQYRNSQDPVFHQFVVFSVIDMESDTVIPKFSACNNCGAVHKVFDIQKSEIITGRDEVDTAMSIEDFVFSLPEDLFNLLQSYSREVPDFEHAQFILENKLWGQHIVLSREELDDYTQGKMVKFLEEHRFKVESYTIRGAV